MDLIDEYDTRKNDIKSMLRKFEKFGRGGYHWVYHEEELVLKKTSDAKDITLFEEMCFCTFTANASAVMGLKSVDAVRPRLMDADQIELSRLLTGKHRYPNARAKYIVCNREFLKINHDFKLHKLLNSFNSPEEAREFIVKNIKGLGYKEASHYLRNIGYKDLCILDKHILRSLHENNIIDEIKVPKNRKEYLEIEKKMKSWAKEININIDELDLLLWGMKTGVILK